MSNTIKLVASHKRQRFDLLPKARRSVAVDCRCDLRVPSVDRPLDGLKPCSCGRGKTASPRIKCQELTRANIRLIVVRQRDKTTGQSRRRIHSQSADPIKISSNTGFSPTNERVRREQPTTSALCVHDRPKWHIAKPKINRGIQQTLGIGAPKNDRRASLGCGLQRYGAIDFKSVFTESRKTFYRLNTNR